MNAVASLREAEDWSDDRHFGTLTPAARARRGLDSVFCYLIVRQGLREVLCLQISIEKDRAEPT